MTLPGIADMVAEAREKVKNLSVEDVEEARRNGCVIVDLREPAEQLETGVIPGAVAAPRGMLEFYADPTSPYYRPEFDRGRKTVLYCASGGRSTLAADTLQRLGFRDVGHLDGGIKAWIAAGGPVVSAS